MPALLTRKSQVFFFRFTLKLLNLSQKYKRVTIATALSIISTLPLPPHRLLLLWHGLRSLTTFSASRLPQCKQT